MLNKSASSEKWQSLLPAQRVSWSLFKMVAEASVYDCGWLSTVKWILETDFLGFPSQAGVLMSLFSKKDLYFVSLWWVGSSCLLMFSFSECSFLQQLGLLWPQLYLWLFGGHNYACDVFLVPIVTINLVLKSLQGSKNQMIVEILQNFLHQSSFPSSLNSVSHKVSRHEQDVDNSYLTRV